MAELPVHLAGVRMALDPAGAVWLPDHRALIVADLHLEKATSFGVGRVRKNFLPPYDTRATLLNLTQLIARRNPALVICLGDSFHDRGGPDRLGDQARQIAALQAGRDWLWITGNHDPELPAHIGGDVAEQIELDGLHLCHEPGASKGGGAGEIAGHLHPVAKIRTRGKSVRRRAFVGDNTRLIVPAFGVLTGGLNVLDPAFARHFGHGGLRTYMLGSRQVHPIGVAALRPD
ncbi:MAG: ligase-associated DNA damage response endonuclease PdeM [Alphaproteobacteria bacterium]